MHRTTAIRSVEEAKALAASVSEKLGVKVDVRFYNGRLVELTIDESQFPKLRGRV